MIQERALFVPDNGYIEVHFNSDGMWDYTLYDLFFQELDGGVIDSIDSFFIWQAVNEICLLHDLPRANLQPLDYQTFDLILDSMRKVEPPW